MSELYGASIPDLSAGAPAARASVGRSSHAAGDLTAQAVAGWMPALRSADADWLDERDLTVARTRDLVRNEAWAQSAVDRLVDLTVGATFRLSAKPDALALGIDEATAKTLAQQIEAKWRSFAEDPTFRCDSQRRLPFAGLIGLIARELVQSGEALALLRWLPRQGWPYSTCVQVLDSDRLSNPRGAMDSDTLRGGVELDAGGAPIAYHLRRRHPNDVSTSADGYAWDRVERWDDVYGWERPKMLHVFEPLRPDQSRGVSRLVAALVKTRLLSRHAESEVKAAALNGSIVGVIYTQLGAEFASEMLGGGGPRGGVDWEGLSNARAGFYGDRKVLDDARFLTAFPSDNVEMNVNPRNTVGFPAFQTAFLQSFAASLGLSYEQLSMDWSKTNYSSARAALNEVWRAVSRLRAIITWGFAQPVYTAWLEDAIDTGDIELPPGAPSFYEAPGAYVRAEWIGPARGYVDPVKEAQAAALRIKARISTYEREIAEQGGDINLVIPQLAREEALFREHGLSSSETDLGVTAPTDDPAGDRRPGEGA